MLFGTKSKKELLTRHTVIGCLAVFLVFLFWLSRPELSFDVRVWRDLGDTTFSFLFITLAISPLAKLWKPAIRLVPWRRETGTWFALLALSHAEKTCEVSFGLSAEKFEFLAEQYIRVNVPKLLYPDPKGISRIFSIASSPNDKNKISMTRKFILRILSAISYK